MYRSIHSSASDSPCCLVPSPSQGVDLGGVQFKEVSAVQLRHMEPSQREAAESVRQALGSEYAGGCSAELSHMSYAHISLLPQVQGMDQCCVDLQCASQSCGAACTHENQGHNRLCQAAHMTQPFCATWACM